MSILIWAVGEGFGGPYTSGATDIGTAIIYALVFAALWGLEQYTAPNEKWTFDHAIARVWPGWGIVGLWNHEGRHQSSMNKPTVHQGNAPA